MDNLRMNDRAWAWRVIDAGIVDPGVLERYRKEARRRKIGYHTLINEVLAQHVGKDVA
jgi:hypothetical protein